MLGAGKKIKCSASSLLVAYNFLTALTASGYGSLLNVIPGRMPHWSGLMACLAYESNDEKWAEI